MSCYEWETGEVLLPAAAVPVVKKALRDETNKLHNLAKRAVHTFWEQHAKKTRSQHLYRQRVETYVYGGAQSERPYRSFHGFGPTPQKHVSGLPLEMSDALAHLLESASDRPHKLTVAEIARVFPQATSSTTFFPLDYEARISFNKRALRWHIDENNRAVDRAHQHPIMIALFAALGRVNWTRGTGGSSWGSNEYDREAAQDHGMNPIRTGNYYGPLGEQKQADEMGMTLAKYRKIMASTRSPRYNMAFSGRY